MTDRNEDLQDCPECNKSGEVERGVSVPMISIHDAIELVSEYCVLDAEPEGDFEKGYHMAGHGIINVLKGKIKTAH